MTRPLCFAAIKNSGRFSRRALRPLKGGVFLKNYLKAEKEFFVFAGRQNEGGGIAAGGSPRKTAASADGVAGKFSLIFRCFLCLFFGLFAAHYPSEIAGSQACILAETAHEALLFAKAGFQRYFLYAFIGIEQHSFSRHKSCAVDKLHWSYARLFFKEAD